MKTTPRCRVCLEKTEETSKLISPCACRGSSRYIHTHCLNRWQLTSFEQNQPTKAEVCGVCCRAYRPGPPLWRRWYYKWKYHRSVVAMLWVNFVVVPAKVLTHALLITVMLLFPWKSIKLLGGLQLSWVGGFPPQIALTSHSDTDDDALRDGVLLVATPAIPETSCFHRAVILVLKHSREHGTKGVIINADTNDRFCFDNGSDDDEDDVNDNVHSPDDPSAAARQLTSPVRQHSLQVGYGGPLERHQLTLLHVRPELADGSELLPLEAPDDDTAAPSDGLTAGGERAGNFIYVAEEDTARAIEQATFPTAFSQFHPAVSVLHPIQLVAQGVHSPARAAAAAAAAAAGGGGATTAAGGAAASPRNGGAPFVRLSTATTAAPLHASLRVIRGHSCWGAGQLAGEIRDGYWSAQATTSDAIFCTDRGNLWPTLAAIAD